MDNFQEKRKHQRFPVNETGYLISNDAHEEHVKVRITYVSVEGVGILADKEFPADKNFTLKYSILLREFVYPVKIVWSRFKNGGYYLGCIKANLV